VTFQLKRHLFSIPVLRIRIRDLGLGAFLTPGSGIGDGRKSASGSGIRDEQPGSYFLELRNHFFAFFGVKMLKFFDEDPGCGMRDPGSGMETVQIRDPGSGMEKSRIRDQGSGINIPDPQQCSIHTTS
jgi:hypothetical protein